eukprot:XP_001702615.1 predicted protein [Chlamydomonas reinhardtii]
MTRTLCTLARMVALLLFCFRITRCLLSALARQAPTHGRVLPQDPPPPALYKLEGRLDYNSSGPEGPFFVLMHAFLLHMDALCTGSESSSMLGALRDLHGIPVGRALQPVRGGSGTFFRGYNTPDFVALLRGWGAAIPGINATVDCQLHAASRRCVRVDSINSFIPLFSNGTVALASMVVQGAQQDLLAAVTKLNCTEQQAGSSAEAWFGESCSYGLFGIDVSTLRTFIIQLNFEAGYCAGGGVTPTALSEAAARAAMEALGPGGSSVYDAAPMRSYLMPGDNATHACIGPDSSNHTPVPPALDPATSATFTVTSTAFSTATRVGFGGPMPPK